MMTTILGLSAAGAGVLSAVRLCFGSHDVPFERQTWKGQTGGELRFKQRRMVCARRGCVALGAAFLLQAAAMRVGQSA